MAERPRIILRWTGTPNIVWNEYYPLSHREILGVVVCEECGLGVDCLMLDSDVSDDFIEKSLVDLRERILETDHGHHPMLVTRELRPGQEPWDLKRRNAQRTTI